MARLDTFEAVATELEARRSFLVEAGAGAGKTTTLVRALQHLLTHHRADLEAHGRRIACITYTNVAKKKIVERIAADPLVDVDTIHELPRRRVFRGYGHAPLECRASCEA
ncbi:hypothetical protein SALBM311S_12394 [Streptomyces alboniger]